LDWLRETLARVAKTQRQTCQARLAQLRTGAPEIA
jgi:hypothetical protein